MLFLRGTDQVPVKRQQLSLLGLPVESLVNGPAAGLSHTGEAVAAKYYIRQGYLLLNHNYRTRMGELDLILYKADTIVFAEVKTRTSAQRAAPAEAVDYYKQQRLIAAAGQYLQQSPYADANIRFDVVEVLPAGSGWQVHCIRDAFASE